MNKKLIFLVLTLTLVGLLLGGCLSKDEKGSLNDQASTLASTNVVISEVYYETSDDTRYEFIELYNMSSSAVTIGGWTLSDNTSTYTIPAGTSIAANSACTIAKNGTYFKRLFGKTANVSGCTLSLDNTGDQLRLKNGTTEIDYVAWENYATGWNIVGNKGKSIERNPANVDTDAVADWKSDMAATPGTVTVQSVTPPPTGGQNPAPGALKVHFVDVGQGDCILIQAPTGEAMLIDAGSYQIEIENKVLSYLRGLGLDHINATVATHPHSDHIGSLDAVINNFPVYKAYDSGYAYTSQSVTDYNNALKVKNVPVVYPRRGDTFNLSADVNVQVLSPTNTIVSAPANVNDVSIVLRVTYKNTSFILNGDAPQFVEQEIITGYNVDSNVLKVGHHGSYTASAPAFVDAVTPTTGAVIMCGEGNSYGHPHVETLNTLNARNIPIYRTDLDGAMNGNIIMTSDGTAVSVQSY